MIVGEIEASEGFWAFADQSEDGVEGEPDDDLAYCPDSALRYLLAFSTSCLIGFRGREVWWRQWERQLIELGEGWR